MDEEKRGGGDHVYFSFKRSGSCFSVPIRIYFGSALGFDSLRWTDLNSWSNESIRRSSRSFQEDYFSCAGT